MDKEVIKVINGIAEDIIKLNIEMDDLKKDWIFKLNDMDKILLNRIDDLNKKVDNYEPKNIIKSLEITAETITEDRTRRLKVYFDDRINTLWKVENRQIDDLKNDMDKIVLELLKKIDDLTSELNGVYKVLEMDSDDIQDLQEEISLKFGKYNNKDIAQDDFNNMMKEGHETLKRVKNNNIDINKIVDEILYKVAPEHIKNNVKLILGKHINKIRNK